MFRAARIGVGSLVTMVGLVALLSWECRRALSEELRAANTEPLFEVATVPGGWAQNAVTAILQTRQGYLWLATYHGLVRFDGVRFTVFGSGNAAGLANGLITSLHEDRRGALWVGHETGHVSRFTNQRFETIPLRTNWTGGVVEAITSDENDDVWLLNDSGLFYRLRDGATLEVPGGASPTRKVALARAPSGKIWLVANGTIASLERGRIVPLRLRNAGPTDFFERVLPTVDGGLWVLGNQRLRKWLGGRWVAEANTAGLAPGTVSVLFETGSHVLLAGTLREGLFVLQPKAQPFSLDRSKGLSHNWVRALCQDHEGNVWIGTGAGLDSLRPRKVQLLRPPDEWQGSSVLSLVVTADSSAWIGTEGAGVYHYENGQWSSFSEAAGVPNPYVWSVLQTRAHQLFVGTWGGGLLTRQGERFVSEGVLRQITAPVVSLYEAQDGVLWIGTTAGLYRLEDGNLTLSAGKDKLAFPDVRALIETPDGALWFGMSGGGLGCLKNGQLKQWRKADGLSSDFVVCLYAKPDGTLWLGTSDSGLIRLKQGKFSTVSTAQGLPSEIICHLIDDERGYLWIGSQRGILRADQTELDRCADGLVPSVRFLSYGKAEGLPAETCSGGFQPGATRATDGRLWFPTLKAVAVVDPAKVVPNTNVPPVVIEELLADDKLIPLPSPTTNSPKTRLASIPAGSRRLEIRYTGLSFIAPDKVQFRYKLEGLDEDWKEAGPARVAEYSYLRPATYRFRVTACNNDGLWNEQGISLDFVVLPFFWQTWWFQTGVVLSGAALIGAGALWATRLRLRSKLAQLERQRALERERARIARDIHDDLGASLTRITMLSQSVRSETETLPETAADADQIYHTARDLTRALDEIVWAVNPKHDTLDSLITYLGHFAQQFLSAAEIRCRLDIPLHLPSWALTSEVRHNVFLAFKEAIHNALKHAHATEVRVSLELQPDSLTIIIADNGCGFDTGAAKLHPLARRDGTRVAVGNGLQNMLKRLQEVGGRCEWDTAPGEGTRVKLLIRHQNR